MYYNALAGDCPLPIDPFKAIVGPRPIGWISSLAVDGTANLAPYSFFNAVNDSPPMVMFSSAGRKDTIENVEATGEFVCNLANWELRDQMNLSSKMVEPGVDEFELAGLEKQTCELVSVPRVKSSPVALECRYLKTVRLDDLNGQVCAYQMVLGQVVGVHIDDRYIENERVRADLLQPLARHGYMDYSVVREIFRIERP